MYSKDKPKDSIHSGIVGYTESDPARGKPLIRCLRVWSHGFFYQNFTLKGGIYYVRQT